MREYFESRRLTGGIKITLDENRIWTADKETLTSAIKTISENYLYKGYTLTLRQLYYQLVSKDLIPNHDKVYNKIGALKDDMIYSGRVDWDCFEDRGRVPYMPYCNDGIGQAIQSALDCFRLNRQEGQSTHVELWTEKDAISDILKRALNPYHIRLVVNKGYTSSSAIYGAYERFTEMVCEGRKVKILYFGDHDPSGLDMIRDIRDRLTYMLCRGKGMNHIEDLIEEHWTSNSYNVYDVGQLGEKFEKVPDLMSIQSDALEELYEEGRRLIYLRDKDLFEVEQIGLTKEQINQYNLPPNPAKITDPRAKNYIREHGKISWEVDALNPEILTELVIEKVEEAIDVEMYKASLTKETSDREELKKIVEKYKDR